MADLEDEYGDNTIPIECERCGRVTVWRIDEDLTGCPCDEDEDSE